MKITLTGLDEKTDTHKLYDAIHAESEELTNVEFGILLSAKPEKRNRYPSLDWIRGIVYYSELPLAIHLCGKDAIKHALTDKLYWVILDKVSRIQVNGMVSAEQLTKFCQLYKWQTIITQHVHYNYDLLDLPLENHAVLVDGSGGNGILPGEWLAPKTTKSYGFAGGLNSGNLEEQLKKIVPLSNEKTWVDMESGLRDKNDWFSIQEAIKCAKIAAQ